MRPCGMACGRTLSVGTVHYAPERPLLAGSAPLPNYKPRSSKQQEIRRTKPSPPCKHRPQRPEASPSAHAHVAGRVAVAASGSKQPQQRALATRHRAAPPPPRGTCQYMTHGTVKTVPKDQASSFIIASLAGIHSAPARLPASGRLPATFSLTAFSVSRLRVSPFPLSSSASASGSLRLGHLHTGVERSHVARPLRLSFLVSELTVSWRLVA
jgi:hypothetical protein